MDTTQILTDFAKELESTFSVSITEIDIEKTVKHIEKTFFPHVMKLMQKDVSFFDEERILFGINLSNLWSLDGVSEVTKDCIWKHIHMCLFASFMHGDLKEKISSIMDIVKSMWGGKNDEISKILDDTDSENHFKEILEYITETRIAKMCMKMVEEIDFSEFETLLKNPEDLLDIAKNPEHPLIKKFIDKVQGLIKQKIQRGEISQQQIVSEIEGVKAKLTSLFGNVFNDAMGLGGGHRGEIPSAILTGNSPEARRQRMLARLQKKHRDKNSR